MSSERSEAVTKKAEEVIKLAGETPMTWLEAIARGLDEYAAEQGVRNKAERNLADAKQMELEFLRGERKAFARLERLVEKCKILFTKEGIKYHLDIKIGGSYQGFHGPTLQAAVEFAMSAIEGSGEQVEREVGK